MRKLISAVLTGLILVLPQTGATAPDETQKMLVQKAQEAKKKLAAAQAAQGVERQKMMQEHMKMMQEVTAQMQKAKPGSEMSPPRMREWIDEHMKLMQEMMSQMMGEHHIMMQGVEAMKGGMGKK